LPFQDLEKETLLLSAAAGRPSAGSGRKYSKDLQNTPYVYRFFEKIVESPFHSAVPFFGKGCKVLNTIEMQGLQAWRALVVESRT
jgi:hypothetical protein